MPRLSISAAVLLAAAIVALGVTAQPAMPFKSETVQLPDNDDLFPPGPQVQVVNNNCLSCHSRDMVLTQPPLSQADWSKEVDKMRKAYKAPVSDADAAVIVTYLAAVKGGK